MVKIMTQNMTVERPGNDILEITPAADQVYFKFSDGTEIIHPTRITPGMLQLFQAAKTSMAKEIIIDFTQTAKHLVQMKL